MPLSFPLPGTVHIWYAPLDQPHPAVARLEETLAPDEWERLRRFHFARDARRYAVRRGFLRALLAAYLQLSPQSISFAYGPQGKPALAGPGAEAGLDFNLSDSGEMAAYVFGRGQALGIDIEEEREITDAHQLGERNFSPEEYAWLQSRPPHESSPAFLRCWTCKEAVVKALGDGLMAPLQAFTAAHWEEPPRLRWANPPGQEWSLRLLNPPPGYRAALALPGPVQSVRERSISTPIQTGEAESIELLAALFND